MSQRILIVDDEPLIAFEIETAITEAGFSVAGIAGTVSKALALIEKEAPEGAIIDANLADESAAPIAGSLREKGVPFMILSGYSPDQIGEWSQGVTVMRKPFNYTDLTRNLKKILASD